MKTILVVNQKGGTGKTTICDELAFACERAGIVYDFYDLDSQGGSLHDPVTHEDSIVSIVDTPGALQPEMGTWMSEADLILIPTRPTVRDVKPLERMIQLVKENNIEVPVVCVIMGWNRYRGTAEFMEYAETMYPALEILTIPQTEGFVQAALSGISIVEYAPESLGAKKVLDLVAVVMKKLKIKMKTSKKVKKERA